MNEKDTGIPEELVVAFSRCQNYPRDPEGVLFLAQGLRRVSDSEGVPMQAIVDRCLMTSGFCPTDWDFVNIAKDIKHDSKRTEAVEQTGPRKCPLGICDGSGWREAFYLWTRHAGTSEDNPAWIEKTAITREQYDDLSTKVGTGGAQETYSARYRCKCHPPRQDEIEKRGRYA